LQGEQYSKWRIIGEPGEEEGQTLIGNEEIFCLSTQKRLKVKKGLCATVLCTMSGRINFNSKLLPRNFPQRQLRLIK